MSLWPDDKPSLSEDEIDKNPERYGLEEAIWKFYRFMEGTIHFIRKDLEEDDNMRSTKAKQKASNDN